MPEASRPRRIHVVGGPGAGKTTFARHLGDATGLPVHHLDDVARVGGGTGPVRTAAEREPLLGAILATDAWITEGVHLGWTEPLLARSELIVRLDAPSGGAAAGRIAGRFAHDAWEAFRRRTWRERVAAVPGYLRHGRDLVSAMLGARRYARGTTLDADGAPPPPVDAAGTLDSVAATDAALAPHADRVVRCATRAEADALVARLAAAALSVADPHPGDLRHTPGTPRP